MLIALAWLVALVAYAVGSWFTRFSLMVVTMPVAGPVRDARSVALLRSIRLVAGAACGAGGFAVAVVVAARLGVNAPFALGGALILLVALVNGPGLRRLAGGPQFVEEFFAFAGEELGLIAAATWHLLP